MAGNGPPPPNDPNYYPQPAPKKKSKTLWIVLGAVGAAVLLCCGFGTFLASMGDTVGDPAGKQNAAAQSEVSPSRESSSPPVSAAAKQEQAAPPPPGVGTPVRDGKFEFTVTGVKCGVAKVGGGFLEKKAQGQFCLVTMQVKNIGSEPRMFDANNQHGFGAGEVKYGADGSASMYANDDNQSFLNEINPGNGITVNVAFDIPKDGRLIAVRLHDSAFSGGVKVVLG